MGNDIFSIRGAPYLWKVMKLFASIQFLFLTHLLLGQADIWRTEDGLSNDWVSDIVQDNDGYLWLATQYGLNRFDGYEFESINYEPNDSNSLSANWVRHMAKRDDGSIFLNCFFGQVHQLTAESKAIRVLKTLEGHPTPSIVRKVFIDGSGRLWIGSDNGLYFLNQDDLLERRLDLSVHDIDQLHGGDLLIISSDGLYRLNGANELKNLIAFANEVSIQQILVDKTGVIWALNERGIFQLREADWQLTAFTVPDFARSRVFNESTIYEDLQGRLWLAGIEGINIISANRKRVEYLSFIDLVDNLSSPLSILKFYEDRDDNIWIGTNKGLLLTSQLHSRFKIPDQFTSIESINGVRSIVQNDETIWLGTEQGLYEIRTNTSSQTPKMIFDNTVHSVFYASNETLYFTSRGKVYKKVQGSERIEPLNSKNYARGICWDIIEDNQGFIWFASMRGLSRYDPKSDSFIKFNSTTHPELESAISQALVLDREGQLWGGSLTNGVYKLTNTNTFDSPDEAIFINYNAQSQDSAALSSNIVQSMTHSPDGSIWVGTDGGLNRIYRNGKVEHYLKDETLIDDKFMSLHVDNNQVLWGSTVGHGVMAMNLENGNVQYFNKNDGLVSNNYLLNSGYINRDGALFLGSDEKTQFINTNEVLKINPILTDLKFHKIQVTAGNLNPKILNIEKGTPIQLPFNQNSFNVTFGTIQFFKPHKTVYDYRILPIQNRWQTNGQSRNVNVNGLSEGNYTLEVKASNPLLRMNPELIQFKFQILPPWWRSWWAYLIYGIAFIGCVYLVLNRRREIVAARQSKELNELKTKLYTNITHEIRTPLTVILGLSAKLMKEGKKSISTTSEIINRNGNHLLLLVNRILDLSKIESGKMPIQLVQDDLISYLSYLLESFHSWAEEKDIRVHFLPREDQLVMDFDREFIKEIINNLMSNAIKYSSFGGDIYCEVSKIGEEAIIQIKDSGEGIDEDKIDFLFERFYQEEAAQNSSGIGLAVTKELVQLLEGSISVKNNLKKGCTFTTRLPITTKAELASTEKKMQDQSIDLLRPDDLYTVLVIEDNDDVLDFIVNCLQGQFDVITARDGKEGLEQCIAKVPDLVLSDVMMPAMNGFEFCEELKSDQRTNHIPVILLTAKADQESRLEGLSKGADDYLIKPFDAQELELRISNLLLTRERLSHKLQNELLDGSGNASSLQDQFLKDIITLIDSNISDSNFGITQICSRMGISRVHLHRKLKALTDQSTAIFIRNVRLNRAKRMLQSSDKNVSEVAYDVGFSDPSYFSKLYTQKFGVSPSQDAL